MKRIWLSVLVVAPLVFSGACSSDDVQAIIDDLTPPQGMIDQLDCLMLGLDDVGWALDGIFDGVVPAIDQEMLTEPESATYDCETGAFAAELDRIDEDGVLDIFLSGTAVEVDLPPDTTDLCDGLDVTEAFTANWTVDLGPTAAPIGDGFGVFTIRWPSANTVTIFPGTATINRDDGCKFEVTSTSLSFNPNDPESNPTGTVEVSVNSGVLTGLMTFNGTNIAAVSFTYDGQVYNFSINLDTGDPIFN